MATVAFGEGLLPRQEVPFMSIDIVARVYSAEVALATKAGSHSHRSKTFMNRGPFVKDPGRRAVSGSPGHEPLS